MVTNGIAYYPDLIKEFEADHGALFAIYEETSAAAQHEELLAFQQSLAKFKSALQSHLLKEAVKLYIYLRQKLRDDEVAYQLVTGYKKEMDGIAKDVTHLIDTWLAIKAERASFADIQAQWSSIGASLRNRMHREETELYPLYHATY